MQQFDLLSFKRIIPTLFSPTGTLSVCSFIQQNVSRISENLAVFPMLQQTPWVYLKNATPFYKTELPDTSLIRVGWTATYLITMIVMQEQRRDTHIIIQRNSACWVYVMSAQLCFQSWEQCSLLKDSQTKHDSQDGSHAAWAACFFFGHIST